MKFEVIATAPDEVNLFYTQSENDEDLGCIGHMRGDFGREGDEFWHSWWGQKKEFEAQAFKDEFDALIDSLRENGLLKNRSCMAKFCRAHPESKILGAWHPDVYGFKTITDNYCFYIRCFPHSGDYNFYIYCYQKNERLHAKPEGMQKHTLPKKKQHFIERE